MTWKRTDWRLWLAITVTVAAAGCRTEAPTRMPPDGPDEPVKSAPSPDSDAAVRPLYTFNEAEMVRYIQDLRAREPAVNERVVRLGRKNIGQPYDIYLLGEFPYEYHDPDPIYCLSKSDCLTFSEHMYAMALGHDWWSFLRVLQRIRYRDGIIGMVTRNHYTLADWNPNNAFLFEDMTTRLGDGQACVPLHQVCRRARFFAKFGIGQDVPDEPIEDHYIPTENVPGVLHELRNGDFVNIIRGDADSQWAGHTGLIAIAPDDTVDFLHSARPAVREQPLMDYLSHNRRCLGIKILRLRPNAQRIIDEELATSPHATDVSEAGLTAALQTSPLMPTGAPQSYWTDWKNAMQMQSYRLTADTPVDAELQARIERLDQEIGERHGIPPADRAFGVLDLTDLRLAMTQPDFMFYGASVPKICILLAYFETHPEAAEELDPQVERELKLMIKRSDNELAAKYSQLVGLQRIQEVLQSKRYRFYDQEHGGGFWCGKHYGIAEPRMGDPVHDHSHAVTVRQCLRFYLMLEQGRLVSAAACAKMKEIFAAPELEFHNKDFVLGLNARDVTIIRKSGWWEEWHLDTARVQHGDRVYLLAGMTRHDQGSQYLAEMAAAVDDTLCGPQRATPYVHNLVLHNTGDDFARGTADGAALSTDEHGATLTFPADSVFASYESPVVESDIPFNEAVVSWNIDAPEKTGFCVGIRVGHRRDDHWSPYLLVGTWGDPLPPGPHTSTCDDGAVEIDYFQSDEHFDRWQYRIQAVREQDAPCEIHVARLAVGVSDLTGIPPAVLRQSPTLESPPDADWQRRLPVPFRSQATDKPELSGRLCSPASVAMVMAYRGVDRPVEQVAAVCHDPAHDIYGNWPQSIQGAYSMGVPGYLARFSDWNDIKWMIAAGQPVVMSIRVDEEGGLTGARYKSTEGHLLVLTGFADDEHVFVNDPAYRQADKGQCTYLRQDLEQVWMRARGGLGYVLLSPE